MSEEIKIKISSLEEELNKLKSDMDEFNKNSKNFMNNTTDKLNDFNSDFSQKVKVVLENISKYSSEQMTKKVNKCYQETKGIVSDFEKLDDEIATSLDK